MHVDLLSANKSRTKEVHATTNGKMTACRINLSKPENIGQFTSIGEMQDVVQITCEKCKTNIAKQLIRESNKEMKMMLKQEQKQMKMEENALRKMGAMPTRDASPVQAPAMHTSSAASQGDYVPPSMRRQQADVPIDAPAPEKNMPKPSEYQIPVVPTAPQIPQPQAAPLNDVLSQFAIPAVPTAPQIPQPQAAPQNDVLSQFAIPAVPTAPQIPQPQAAPFNDVLSQFALPPQTAAPQMPEPPVLPQAPVIPQPQNDVLSQFAIPSVPTAPQAPAQVDDILAQFSVPTPANDLNVPSLDVPEVPAAPVKPASPTLSDPEDILAQFSMPTPQQVHAAATAQAGASLNPFDTVANSLFDTGAAFAEVQAAMQPAAPAADEPIIPEIADIDDIPELSVPAKPDVPFVDDLENGDGFSANLNAADGIVEVMPESLTPAGDSDIDPLDDLFVLPTEKTDDVSDSGFSVMPDSINTVPETSESDFDDIPSLDELENLVNAAQQLQAAEEVQTPDLSAFPEISNVASAAQTVQDVLPDLTTVPTELSSALPDLPELVDVPTAPQLQQPAMPVPPQFQQPVQPILQPTYPQPAPMPQQFQQPMGGFPGYPQQPAGVQYANPANQQNNLFAVPKAVAPRNPNTPMPLFVGYGADGRQIFQTYDELGKPVPINEPVYSTPPLQPENPFVNAAKGVGVTTGLQQGGAPVLDMEELMGAMGIEDPSKKKNAGSDKEVKYTEYKIPPKQKKTPAAAQPKAEPPKQEGPVSAAEAKRRKKMDKINKEFEKQLRARGVDPATGAFVGKDNAKKK